MFKCYKLSKFWSLFIIYRIHADVFSIRFYFKSDYIALYFIYPCSLCLLLKIYDRFQ